ncbi:MAG: DivIVA domain-containing protein [Acidimicrobiia bacterium]|nr:DivIVA domain-containing protein [Acidimicrobiia bacterium]
MADLVSPDQIRSRSFRTTFRGYDQSEVAEFLDRVARMVEALETEHTRLRMRADQQADPDLRTEFQRVTAEVGEVLEAARSAAEGMRVRAAAEVAEWRRSAEDAALQHRDEAQSDAEALRGDAWSTSKEMLEASQAEARQIMETAEREALAIVGHAERESHRSQAGARRAAEESVRTAKMESERLLSTARVQHDEIIDTARKQAEAAQERARALEVRRDELLAELETVRSKIHAMETEIGEQRAPIPADPAQPASVRLIPAVTSEAAAQPRPADWAPADSVRIIPARKIESEEPVDAASLADEVRRLRDDAALAELNGRPAVGQDPELEPEVDEPDDDDAVADEVPESEEPDGGLELAVEATEPRQDLEIIDALDDEPVVEEAWALDSLFATLREPPKVKPAAAPEYPEESGVQVPPPAALTSADEAPAATVGSDAIAERDQLLLPITNRILRGVKRQLTEAQNLTLEDVRVKEHWDPESVDLADRVRGDLLILVQESYAAGQSAAGSSLGVETGRPRPRKGDIPDHSEDFSSALLAALSHVAESAGEQGPRALSASLSRVYRAWRTDEAERRIREFAARAFHRGMLAGASSGGGTRVRWVLAGRGCPTCKAAAKVGSVAIDSDFPGIEGVPPVHPGCNCTVVPA